MKQAFTLSQMPGKNLNVADIQLSKVLPVIGLAIAAVLPFVVAGYTLFQLTLVMIYAIAVLGLNILTGYSGQFSLGHSAFFAVGAYIAAIVLEQWSLSYALTPILAGLFCCTLGYLIGIPASRLQGSYLALATFALAIATPPLLKLSLWEDYTGGVQGIFVDVDMVAPAFLPLSPDQWLYFFVMLWLIAFLAIAASLRASRSGRAMLAVRENEIAAKAMGVDTVRTKATAFAISAFYTGAAGALAALTVKFISPDSYTLLFSIALLVALVTGGVGSIWGALFGAAFILYVPNVADAISKSLAGAIYALILIAIVFLMPEGFAGGVKRLNTFIQSKLQGRTK